MAEEFFKNSKAIGFLLLELFLDLFEHIALATDKVMHHSFHEIFILVKCQEYLTKTGRFLRIRMLLQKRSHPTQVPLVTVFYRKTFLSTTLTYLLNTVRPRVYNGTKAFKNSLYFSFISQYVILNFQYV